MRSCRDLARVSSGAETCFCRLSMRASSALPGAEMSLTALALNTHRPGIGAPWVIDGAAGAAGLSGAAAWAKAPEATAIAARPDTVAARNLEVMLIKTLWRWRTGRFRFCRSNL